MGLDITAYRKLKKMDVVFDAGGFPLDPTTRECIDDYFKVYSNPDFPGREAGLEDRAVYSFAEEKHVFSRSYGGYGRWRDTLAKLAGYPLSKYTAFGQEFESYAAGCWKSPSGPFAELINFADNEGTIGPVVAAKLAHDFAEWDERAMALVDDDGYFYDGYVQLRRGFDMAADGGALRFS